MNTVLLHLVTPSDWRVALSKGAVSPLPDVGFVHLSTPEQVALPANRLFAGRRDLVLLALDPDRIGVEVRFEPGVPGDPESMRFPHAYGPVPTAAVLAVLPYRPGPDGRFAAPVLPALDTAGRMLALEPSIVRRAAASEIPVTGGVAVRSPAVAASWAHNQLIVERPVPAATLVADADEVLGGAGIEHRMALLVGEGHDPTAAELASAGWRVAALAGMAAPAGGEPSKLVEHLDVDGLRSHWTATWRRNFPGISDADVRQLAGSNLAEEAVADLRYLGVRAGADIVASAVLKIDGATALLDAVATDPEHRGRGHGDALVTEALAVAGEAGCDLVVLDALVEDWPREWYLRRGFTEVARLWSVLRP